MKITKFGHACLLIEEGEARILTDPGSWNTPPEVEALDAILITHEHADHCDIGQLKSILAKNPNAQVITHAAVGKLLDAEGISTTLLEDGATRTVNSVSVQSCGTKHEIIYGDFPQCQNTGYYIAGKLFVPGDSLHDIPPGPVEVLGLPAGGPWMRLSEAIDYAKRIKPKAVFPLHDAMYTAEYRDALIPRIIGGNLEPAGIAFYDMKAGTSLTL